MKLVSSVQATLMLSSLAAAMTAFAASSNNNDQVGKTLEQQNVVNYWTPERLKNAQPLPLPKVNPYINKSSPENITQMSDSEAGDGGLPDKNVKIKPQHLFTLNANDEGPGTDIPDNPNDKPVPNNNGTYNRYFTSSRLVPLTADTSYPYSAVGKLFFTIPGKGDYVCSAAVLRPRVVVTAGHCTHKGSGGSAGFYTNFVFIPAYRDGTAPYQSWYPSYVQTTSTWASGNGDVPNAADYSMFQMSDKVIGSTTTKIASVTGYFGYRTLALSPNHATLLGYPCNLDSCAKMHQVTAGSGSSVSPNNIEYGSDMRGGSSGGPWVQNFGSLAVGQTGGLSSGLNQIIGITSYGYESTDPKVQGSSIPDSRFTNLLTAICNRAVGNC